MMESVEMMREERVGSASIAARLLAACIILALFIAGFLVAKRGDVGDELWGLVLTVVGFGIIGFFYLVCTCLGICRLTSSEVRKGTLLKMLDKMNQAIVITDQEGSIRYMNQPYRQLTGGKRRKIEVLFSIDDKASQAIAKLSQGARSGISGYDELSLPCSFKGKSHEEAVYAVHVNQSEVAGEAIYIWMLEDISRRRQHQEQQFANLTQAIDHLDHAPAGFVAWDKSGKITYLNATLANWIGVDLTSHVPENMTLSRLVGAQCAAELQKIIAKTSPSKHQPTLLELDLFHDTGQRLHVHCYLSAAIEGEGGRALLMAHVSSHQSSLDRDVIRLEEDALHFAQYFNACPIALAVIDGSGLIQTHNPSFASLFNLVTQQKPLKIQDLIAADDDTDVTTLLTLTSKTGQATPFDTRMRVHEETLGESRHIRLFMQQLVHDDGCFIIGVVETSEQKVLERHVGALEQHMEQGQKMQAVGQLAGGIAHDFNNVLTAIIMSCDLLLSNHRSSDPSHPDLMNIKNNAGRAATLVRQLLTFSRRQTLQPEIIDVSDMLADLRLLMTRLVGIHITIKIEHGRDLWLIKADKSELGRAIINLATNARDAMPEGGTLTIRSANVENQDLPASIAPHLGKGDYILIEVRDSGMGMDQAVREKIFEPFFTTKEVGRGTGLGLSMVYGMITQSGGYIHCDSEPDKGTVFSLYLPRHLQEQGEDYPPSSVNKNTSALALRDLSGSATVLVVEDEDGVRMGSVKALQSRGYQVLEATTGMEAFDIVTHRQGKVDLIVSDVVMPEMDGPTLLKEVRPLYPEIKFIFVSGYAQEAFARNLPKQAQFAFLPKPFSLKQLALKVKEMLEKKQEEVL